MHPRGDNGSVIVSGYSSDKWTFTTIYEPIYGEHPVSGNRDFGFTYNADGGYTFYTRGVDRLTSWDGGSAQNSELIGWLIGGKPFEQSDHLWSSFQDRVGDFVINKGGKAIIAESNPLRPNWQMLRDVLEGKRPLSDLSKDCN